MLVTLKENASVRAASPVTSRNPLGAPKNSKENAVNNSNLGACKQAMAQACDVCSPKSGSMSAIGMFQQSETGSALDSMFAALRLCGGDPALCRRTAPLGLTGSGDAWGPVVPQSEWRRLSRLGNRGDAPSRAKVRLLSSGN